MKSLRPAKQIQHNTASSFKIQDSRFKKTDDALERFAFGIKSTAAAAAPVYPDKEAPSLPHS
jgi:hypothetical protein